MDNVVQNISIKDIIPNKFQPNLEEKQKIVELANLIKQFGMLDPIIVRPKDEKYEIILGIEKYEAALLANQTSVPVIIKEVDDEVYSKYKTVDSLQDVSLIDQSKETFSKKEENTDIINLDELSKIKLEYERDDVKMNNGQFNNDMNNNFGAPNSQGPTFGGRFFPSLEDEPTNMNMMGGIGTQTSAQTSGVLAGNEFNNNNNNNLIDLTDLSLDKEPSSVTIPNMGETTPPPTVDSVQTAGFDLPNFGTPPAAPVNPAKDNIISIESIQKNNQASVPTNEPVSMDILNADFGPPSPPMMDNKLGMGQQLDTMPMQPQGPAMMGAPGPQPMLSPMQPNYGMPQQGPAMMGMPGPQPMSGLDMNMMPPMQPNYGPMPAPISPLEPSAPMPKDTTPVVNTIKNLVTSLEAFGYKINLNEESLPTTTKIIIEIEK